MIGQSIGQYQILAELGRGGMGEVYRARDTKLNRDVAIKVLPEAFALDADRLARFTREAQVLASLNHPNIAQIFGIESNAIVMELVEGRDLSELIFGAAGAQAPALHLTDALPIAKQIADALEAAHEQGIIHRDLKPQNIKVRDDGTVKVLDFGLARTLDPGPGTLDPSHSPTMTARATQLGMIIGTAAYMSPEQARGKAVDRRADIWAFGVVLYEMLTGRRAFEGEDVSVTLANVIKEAPKWDALPADVPSSIRRLLRRCLEKDPKRRLGAISDARFELDEAATNEIDRVTPAQPFRSRERLWMVATAASLIGAASLAVWLWPQPAAPAPPVKFTIPAPEGERFPFYDNIMAISPDGRTLIYVIRDGLKSRLWLRPLDSLTAQAIPGTDGAGSPVWSPDSRSIVFNDGPLLKRVDTAGGQVLTLATAVGINLPAWSPSGVILFTGTDGRLYQVPDRGGTPTLVMEFDASRQEMAHRWPVFLPDGRRFIFSARSNDPSKSALFLASLDEPGRTHLVDVLSKVAYAEGYLLYQREGALLAQSFDETRGQIAGGTLPVADGVDYNPNHGHAVFSVSRSGTLVYRSRLRFRSAILAWFDASGKAVGPVGEFGTPNGVFRLSPDRTKLALTRSDGKQDDIWVIDLGRGVPSRLTFDPARDTQPVWSADGSHLAFRSERSGRTAIYRHKVGSAGDDELLFESASDVSPWSFSADGQLMLIERRGANQSWDVWAVPTTPNAKPVPIVATPFDDRGPVLSPDGRWLAYYSNKTGDPEVYVQSYPVAAQEIRISTGSGLMPMWSADGRRLYYRAGTEMMSVELSFSNGAPHAGAPVRLFQKQTTSTHFGFDPVGPRFLLAVEPEANDAAPLTVVLNWASGLRK